MFSTPNIEYIVGRIMCKTLPFCSENSGPFQLHHAHMTNGTRLLTAQLQCSGTGTGEPGNETKYLLHKFHIECCGGLGMRLCHVLPAVDTP